MTKQKWERYNQRPPGNEKTSRNTVCSGNAISLCDSMTETAVFLVVMQQIDEQEVNKE